MKIHLTILLMSTLLALNCTAPPESDPPVATFRGGQVLKTEVGREIRFMTDDERQYREIQGMSTQRIETDLARRIALRKIAATIAENTDLTDDPQVAEEVRRSARDWLLDRWRESCYDLPFEVPGDDALRAEIKVATLPPRVKLSHIFRRAETPEEITAAVSTLESLRTRIGSLEEFTEAVHSYSESESAHRDGHLGWIRPGWLPEAAENTIFELPTGSISSPIELRGGVHLFFVEAVKPAETLPVDRRLARLRAKREAEARDACRAQRLGTTGVDIEVEVEVGDGEIWPDITVGAWKISGSTLATIYSRPDLTPAETRQRWIEDERLFQTAIGADFSDRDEQLRLDDLEGNVVLGRVVNDMVEERLDEPDPAEIEDRFVADPSRYRTQRQLKVEVLWSTVPNGADPIAFWDQLQDVANDLRDRQTDFQRAAVTIGPEADTERWPSAPLREVTGALGPVVFERIKNHRPGDIVGPIQDGERFWIVEILDDQPVRPMTVAEAEPRIRAEILRERRNSARGRVVIEMLEGNDFHMVGEVDSEQGIAPDPTVPHPDPANE